MTATQKRAVLWLVVVGILAWFALPRPAQARQRPYMGQAGGAGPGQTGVGGGGPGS